MKKLLLISMSLALVSFTGESGKDADSVNKATEVIEISGVKVGEKAPFFKLKNIDGKEYSFENIKDGNGNSPKGYIVIFTCNTCPVAKANEQRIIQLHEKYSSKGYPVVAIQPNDPGVVPGDSFDAMKTNAREKGFEFLYLFDDGQEIYPKYGATRTPEVFLVDNELTVRYHGAIDDNARDEDGVKEKFLENAIKSVENGEDPEPATTKAVGCGIKTA
jgi:peroxiredoxin